ncbi:threonine dehydratase [Granulicella aggregans]|uniref:Threonine dehydratase n=1 Tax=Granulicella aggregans TaxID=474949 RepID=A0A7W7ZIK4_9BACT|nr:pyridoxal-phosphate dependent enzyme [Granulicella aggregans]MBB5060403.1 threonine dehydratase [Granulicella aggregans]
MNIDRHNWIRFWLRWEAGVSLRALAIGNRNTTAVIGVEPELSPTMTRAPEAGGPVDADVGGIAADSLAPKRVGEHVFPLANHYVKQVVLVSEEEIRSAQRTLWNSLRVVAEPGRAAAFSAVLSGKYIASSGEHIGIVISGGKTVAVDF